MRRLGAKIVEKNGLEYFVRDAAAGRGQDGSGLHVRGRSGLNVRNVSENAGILAGEQHIAARAGRDVERLRHRVCAEIAELAILEDRITINTCRTNQYMAGSGAAGTDIGFEGAVFEMQARSAARDFQCVIGDIANHGIGTEDAIVPACLTGRAAELEGAGTGQILSARDSRQTAEAQEFNIVIAIAAPGIIPANQGR